MSFANSVIRDNCSATSDKPHDGNYYPCDRIFNLKCSLKKHLKDSNILCTLYLQSEGIDETRGISREESPRFKLYNSSAADVLQENITNIY